MIPFDIQSVHYFSTEGVAEIMNQVVYLWELQSDLSHVASSMHLMVG